ncbi:MAG TPA: hypothetical protein DCE41_35315 [Cytophagales bacterium]|nr:hypothetical protein [Cytophagales bacterium]HAA23163.1 hypothetical protein [Cytophagales bacterium]HAP60060.1 hypothetical protein [Cytophagales bacterium]
MKIERTEFDKELWEEITLATAIAELEADDYWQPGTTEIRLANGETLYTPTHQYRQVGGLNGLGALPQNELGMEIGRMLDHIFEASHPEVWTQLQEDRETLEDSLYAQCMAEGITPATAINQLEQTFNGL